MTVTTMKLQSEVRDRLARVAVEDYAGVSLSDAVGRLLTEHDEMRMRLRISAAYARLREDPAEWADYVSEIDEWDGVTSDSADDT